MTCSCGSHKRRINLPMSHGVYVKGHPVMNRHDCSEDNIPSFGICSSGTSSKAPIIKLFSREKGEIEGFRCERSFLGVWEDAKEGYGLDGSEALKKDSYIICEHGGIIRFENSGQTGSCEKE